MKKKINVNGVDITGDIGSLHSDAKCTMYSFERPAYNFWNGIAEGMIANGATYEEVYWWLSSKNARWLLDNMDQEIQKMGKKYGKKVNLNDLRIIKHEESINATN